MLPTQQTKIQPQVSPQNNCLNPMNNSQKGNPQQRFIIFNTTTATTNNNSNNTSPSISSMSPPQNTKLAIPTSGNVNIARMNNMNMANNMNNMNMTNNVNQTLRNIQSQLLIQSILVNPIINQ